MAIKLLHLMLVTIGTIGKVKSFHLGLSSGYRQPKLSGYWEKLGLPVLEGDAIDTQVISKNKHNKR